MEAWNERKDRRSLLAPDDALVKAAGAPTSVASVGAHISSGSVAKHQVLLQPVDDGDVPPNSSEWYGSGYNFSPYCYLQLIICRSVHYCMYLQSIMCIVGTWLLYLSHVYS